MIKNPKINRLVTLGLAIAFVVSLAFAVISLNNRLAYAKSVDAQNAKIAKINRDVRQSNANIKNVSIQAQAEDVLNQAFNGSLTNASDMWDYLHKQTTFTGLTSMQGDSKDFFKSTYFNGVTSNVGNILASETDDHHFVLSFTYTTTSLTGTGNTQTRQVLYVATGTHDGNTYHVDDLRHTNSTNY